MKTAGIIVEYNPFHNGHKYHIERTKELTGCDFVIAVMSGNYMQRGVPAVIDKYARTEMALQNGVDLVLELPLFYASASAEYFALGAVSLLNKLEVTDSLCFGSECGDVHILSEIASVLIDEPTLYREVLQARLRKGLSYPKARSEAISTCLSSPAYVEAISSPNNILGIEYIKALKRMESRIHPYTIQRKGGGYHDTSLIADFKEDASPKSSASAIRQSMNGIDGLFSIEDHVPPSVYERLSDSYQKSFPIRSDDFSLLLKYKLLSEEEEGYMKYVDVSSDLSDKIKKNLRFYRSFEQFCELLKSKDMTYSRISRCLLHILLDIKKEELTTFLNGDCIYYARMLGFRKEAEELLHEIRIHSSIPLISKLADAAPFLNEAGNRMLKKEIQASHIYDSVVAHKFDCDSTSEYSKRLVIL